MKTDLDGDRQKRTADEGCKQTDKNEAVRLELEARED